MFIKYLTRASDRKLMESGYPWAQAFQISKEQIAQWETQKPPEYALSYWCLSQNLLNPQLFLKWAKEYYQIPSVSSDFFTEAPLKKIWHELKESHNWSEQILPITVWDNTIFAACVEPPQKNKLEPHIQYVLAPYSNLKDLWSQLNSVNSQSHEEAQTLESSDDDPIILEDLDISPTVDGVEPETPREDSWSMPEGLELNLSPPSSNSTEISEITQLPQLPNDDIFNSTSPGLNAFDSSSAEINMESLMPEGLQLNENEKVDSSSEFLQNNEPLVKDNEPMPSAPTQLDEFTSEVYPETATSELEILHMEKSQSKSISQVSHNVIEKGVDNADEKSPPTSTGFNIQNPQIESIFTELLTQFSHVAFFRLQGKELISEIWDKTWNFKNQSVTIPLIDPSVFRIAMVSKMSFHGKPHPSPTNDLLFKAWSSSDNQKNPYPQHCTAVPVNSHSQLIGLLILTGNEECASLNYLQFAEEHTQKLSGLLDNNQRKTG